MLGTSSRSKLKIYQPNQFVKQKMALDGVLGALPEARTKSKSGFFSQFHLNKRENLLHIAMPNQAQFFGFKLFAL